MSLNQISPISYSQLPGWGTDTLENVYGKLLETLQVFSKSPEIEIGGQTISFNPILSKLSQESSLSIEFIEANFQPYRIVDEESGTFTGYFEPRLQASFKKDGEYPVPIYENPEDLFYIPNLGKYNKHLSGERLAGVLVEEGLIPYSTRGDIYKGCLDGKAKILAWVKSAVDLFFLHVQGSGVLEFEDGSHQRIGYSGTNGHAYKSIGRHLLETGVIPEKDFNMEGVKAYLNSLDLNAQYEALAYNPSYIFFEKRIGKAPIGTLGVELLHGRSLAVDPKYIPLGLPLWLECDHPKEGRIQNLMLAHDTGSAIKGPVRGDYFWGTGEEAGSMAGIMKSSGTYYLLLPKT